MFKVLQSPNFLHFLNRNDSKGTTLQFSCLYVHVMFVLRGALNTLPQLNSSWAKPGRWPPKIGPLESSEELGATNGWWGSRHS